jgi:2-polyprenyl-3-methyl-5-hydroxy-6-metoxy-1,4-benzoquinol methylase
MSKELYEKMEAGYYHKVFLGKNPVQRYWHEHKFNKIIDKIKFGKNIRILDLGCGPGTLLSLIKKPFKTAYGVDFDEKQINFAKKNFKNNKIKWIHGDITKLNSREKFTYIISSEVIEHISYKDTRKMLLSAKKYLAEDGTLILTTPNYESFWPVIEWFVNRLGKVNYKEQHINKLNAKKLETLLKECGFKIKKIQTFYIIAPFLSFISKRFAEWIQKIEEKLFPKLGSLIIVEAET